MQKIHITLVGGQPIPVYLGIKQSKPDSVIFVCSEQSIEETNRIRKELDIDSEILIFDPVDLEVIGKAVEELANRLHECRLSINISSGTKPWAYYFIQTFGNREKCEILYVDQNNLVRNFNDFSQQAGHIGMDARFRLHGNPLSNFMKLSDYTAEDLYAIHSIRQIRKFNFRDFNYLTEQLSRHPNKTFIESNSGSKLEWDSGNKSLTIQMYNNSGVFKSEVFDSPNVRNLFQNTGWFELEVAELLSKWDKAKEVRINCVFSTLSNSPKNEIDIIVDTGTKLLFVECKTQIRSETDVDKFASAVKVYGGTGSKALFVTDAPIRDKALEKCRDNKVIPFSLVPNRGSKVSGKTLFQLLDKELYNINTK